MEEALQFEQLEIEGHTFTVIRNSERLYSKDSVIGLDILLRLSPEEFQTFQSLRRLGPITIRRVGIDESPIVRRFGGAPARNGPPSVPSVPRRITTFPTPSNPVGRYVSPTGTSPATAILMFPVIHNNLIPEFRAMAQAARGDQGEHEVTILDHLVVYTEAVEDADEV